MRTRGVNKRGEWEGVNGIHSQPRGIAWKLRPCQKTVHREAPVNRRGVNEIDQEVYKNQQVTHTHNGRV